MGCVGIASPASFDVVEPVLAAVADGEDVNDDVDQAEVESRFESRGDLNERRHSRPHVDRATAFAAPS